MRRRNLVFFVALVLLAAGIALPAPAEAQSRIAQQVVINGQVTNGAFVTTPAGGMQTFTCDSPQQYTTPDGAVQGWACYDGTTGVWLLNSAPPTAGQPPVIYQQPATVVYQPSPVVVAPVVVYQRPVRPIVVAPAYPPSVVLGAAAINATGRIVASAISRPVFIARPRIVRPYVVRGHHSNQPH